MSLGNLSQSNTRSLMKRVLNHLGWKSDRLSGTTTLYKFFES